VGRRKGNYADRHRHAANGRVQFLRGTITKWLKKPGEKVQRVSRCLRFPTDKVDAEIPAPASGVLQDNQSFRSSTVQVNTVVGTISLMMRSGCASSVETCGVSRARRSSSAPAAPERKEPAESKGAQAPPQTKQVTEVPHHRRRRTCSLISPACARSLASTTSIWLRYG